MIRLNRLSLSGYKSIKHCELDMLSLNVLIGANGAGKSNLLSFFKMLNYITDKGLSYYIYKSGGANALLHYGGKTTPVMEFELQFETEKGFNVYSTQLEYAAGDTLIFADEQIGYSAKGTSVRPPKSIGNGHIQSMLHEDAQLGPSIKKTANAIRNLMSTWRYYQFHDTSELAAIKQKANLHDNRFLHPDAANLSAFLYSLKKKHIQYYQRIVHTIRLVAPYFDDFVLIPLKLDEEKIMLDWREKGNENVFRPFQLSDGALRFIALATLLLQPELPSLIIIDEPELGLHPYAINVLASLLRSAALKTQIIVSTQSITLVNELSPEEIIVVDREQGETNFKRLETGELSVWLEDYTLGELWQKNVLGGRPSR